MKKGKELELLLEKIQEVLTPDAIIKSPDYVIDVDTGTNREVDIGIKYNTEQGDFYLAIECRDRGSIQDIMWIEQLISKKRSICADVLVAVTSSSFTEPAKIKATKNGIVLRTLEKFDGKDIITLANATYVDVHTIIGEIDLASVKFLIKDLERCTDYIKDIDKCKYCFGEINEQISFNDLLPHLFNDNIFLGLKTSVPRHGDVTDKMVSLNVDNLYVLMPHKSTVLAMPNKQKVLQVKAKIRGKKIVERYLANRLCRYNECNDLLAELVEYEKGSSMITNNETGCGICNIDLSQLKYKDRVVSSVVLKCKEPTVLQRYTVKI